MGAKGGEGSHYDPVPIQWHNTKQFCITKLIVRGFQVFRSWPWTPPTSGWPNSQGPQQNISEMGFSEPPWPNSTPQGSEHPISDQNPYFGSAGVWKMTERWCDVFSWSVKSTSCKSSHFKINKTQKIELQFGLSYVTNQHKISWLGWLKRV